MCWRDHHFGSLCKCPRLVTHHFVTALQLDAHQSSGHDACMLIFKIFRKDEWADLQRLSETEGASIDVADGYIHFSTAETVKKTADKYFPGVEELVLCAVEADTLEPLKWEPAREGVLFPHLYRKIRLSDIVWTKPLPVVDGRHQFPDLA